MTPDADLRQSIMDAEAVTKRNATAGQQRAGNYRKGRFRWNGLEIAVETPKGEPRSGVGPDGTAWSVTMPATYGYFTRTRDADDDGVDVYVGPEPEDGSVYVIDQVDADTGLFDEHKVMIGYLRLDEALADYDRAFDDGRGPDRRRAVTQMDVRAFREWIRTGDLRRPMRADDSQRVETPEGMIRSGAIITRAGPVEYTRHELGLQGDGSLTVHRTIESLRHPDTIKSLRGAPITLGHPPKGVTPKNFKRTVVGAVAGEPKFEANTIVGDVLIGDAKALKQLKDGVRELSIGYDFFMNRDGETVGPIRVNHVALVERGRAGSSVRVLDSLDASVDAKGVSRDTLDSQASEHAIDTQRQPEDRGMSADAGNNLFMKREDVQAAIDHMLDMGMKHRKMDADQQDAMRKMVDEALAPLKDAMSGMQDAASKLTDAERKRADDEAVRQAEAEAEANRIRAKDAAEAIVKETRDERDQMWMTRFSAILDAQPLIPEEKREGLLQMDTRDILVLAVGDQVPDAKEQSIEFLRGAVNMLKRQRADDHPGFRGPGGGDNLPAGVVPFRGQDSSQHLTGQDARRKAVDEFVDAQSKAYADAGGV